MNIARLFCGFGLLFLLTSCSTTLVTRQNYLTAYQNGQLSISQSILDQTIDDTLPNHDYMHSKDAVMLLLDRAMVNFVAGQTEEAIQDFQWALDAMDYYQQDSTSELLGQLLLEDGIGAYAGEDFEQILTRIYFALALLQINDQNNALALLRQAEELQQKKQEIYRKDPLAKDFFVIDNSIGKYLLAALLEHRGDLSNAEILYSQTEKLIGNTLVNLQLKDIVQEPDQATVIIVAHNGNAPYKISTLASATQASPLALEMLLNQQDIKPAVSSLPGIPVPLLMQHIHSHRVPIYTRLYRQERNLIPLYNITAVAAHDLQQKMPLILAKGAARFLLRRGSVAYLNEKDPCLGAIADMSMLIANACTQADIRSWATLPSSIDITRYSVPPGEHTLHLQIQWGVTLPLFHECALKLAPRDFCVINIFNIHPGIVSVQIPDHCKNKIKEEFLYDSQSSQMFNDASISGPSS